MIVALFIILLCINTQVVAQNCLPTAKVNLDVNNIRAGLLNGGDMWGDLSSPKFEFPKSAPGSPSPKHIIECGGLWLSGMDNNFDLRLAAQKYRNGNDFFPGPLKEPQTNCSFFDKFFKVSSDSVDYHIALAQASGGNVPVQQIPKQLLDWPARGNPHLAAQGQIIANPLAPFKDVDGNGIYEPEKGDYPLVKGTEAFWCVINDAEIHTSTHALSLDVEVQILAYAFKVNGSSALNDATFYEYTITNKSDKVYNQFYVSKWIAVKSWYYQDSYHAYVGCDSSSNLAYWVNPKIGMFLAAARILDVTINMSPVNKKLSSFMVYNGEQSGPRTLPLSAPQYRYNQLGRWLDNSPMTFGGNGYGGSTTTSYMYHGNPAFPSEWSECNNLINGANPDGRRQFLMNSGPFTLSPNGIINYSMVVFGVVENVGVCPDITNHINPAANALQSFYDVNLKNQQSVSIKDVTETRQRNNILVKPNPSTELKFSVWGFGSEVNEWGVIDMNGREIKIASERNPENGYDLTFMQPVAKGVYVVYNKADVSSRTKFIVQ